MPSPFTASSTNNWTDHYLPGEVPPLGWTTHRSKPKQTEKPTKRLPHPRSQNNNFLSLNLLDHVNKQSQIRTYHQGSEPLSNPKSHRKTFQVSLCLAWELFRSVSDSYKMNERLGFMCRRKMLWHINKTDFHCCKTIKSKNNNIIIIIVLRKP